MSNNSYSLSRLTYSSNVLDHRCAKFLELGVERKNQIQLNLKPPLTRQPIPARDTFFPVVLFGLSELLRPDSALFFVAPTPELDLCGYGYHQNKSIILLGWVSTRSRKLCI
jgi:hypothetical protein